MGRRRLERTRSRVKERVEGTRSEVEDRLMKAFFAKYSEQEVAMSFGIGMFITALPTLGVGLLVFLVIGSIFENLSKIALFASVLVLSPPVKWGVYASSYWLGAQLLGPVQGISFETVEMTGGVDVLTRLWLGNLILAVVFAGLGYVAAIRILRSLDAY